MLNHLKVILPTLLFLTVSAVTMAAEMDHSKMGHDMSGMDHSQMGQGNMKMEQGMLEMMHKMPASGKAREAGSDGRYAMESIMDTDKLADRCAKASRGLMMMDNAGWQACGGRPAGWSKGPGNAKPMDHSQHMMH